MFQYKTSRGRRGSIGSAALPERAPLWPEEVGGMGSIIQGQRVASKEEWNLAMALDSWGLSFQYQVPIRGGRSRRGGLVVDFVVYNPWPIAVQVQGQYWHTGMFGAYENLEEAQIKRVFKRMVEFTDIELATVSIAKDMVLAKIVHGGG